jgi:hypothetical protein
VRLLSLPQDENQVERGRFDTVEDIQAELQTILNTLTKKDFQDALQKWQNCWDRCVAS